MNKKTAASFSGKRHKENIELDFNEYAEMFQEGLSDAEISNEFGVDESFVRSLREEYQSDY